VRERALRARVRGVAGGWVGYVYSMVGCGAFVGVILASALVLYAWGRVKERRRPSPRILVTSVRARDDGPGPV